MLRLSAGSRRLSGSKYKYKYLGFKYEYKYKYQRLKYKYKYLGFKYEYKYKYQRLKYKYKYLGFKYEYKYKYQRLKYKYKYLGFKYEYKYKYLDLVLEYNSSTSTSTKYYSCTIASRRRIDADSVFHSVEPITGSIICGQSQNSAEPCRCLLSCLMLVCVVCLSVCVWLFVSLCRRSHF